MPPIFRQRTRAVRNAAAFTLVEIMVAIVILVIITLIMAEIFGGTQALVAQSNTSMGSLDAGETVLSQIGLDISRMVLREDVDYDFTKQGGNDRLSFYARTTGFDSAGGTVSSPRPLSVVSYQVGTNPANSKATALQLNYGALQIDWGVGTATFTPFTLSALIAAVPNQFLSGSTTGHSGGDLPLPAAASYTTLAQEVIRFEFCCMLKVDPAGNSPPQLLTPTVPTAGLTSTSGATTYTAAPIANLAGVLVGIVVVDPRSRLLFPTGADATLSGDFADPANNNEDFLTLWSPKLTPATLKSDGIPAQAITGIHIYQRYYAFPW